MEILYLSRSNSGEPHPFILEQAAALEKYHHVRVKHLLVEKGGIFGYSKAMYQLLNFLKYNRIDIIHAHYGLSALVAVISRILYLHHVKIIITYHGSDINDARERKFSLFASKFAAHNILVSEKMLEYFQQNFSLIPCGVDTDVTLCYRESTRKQYGWEESDFVILFSSSFARKEKDPDFGLKVVQTLAKSTSKKIKFIELKGYTREQLTKLMQAADALIMCSEMEGSPQVIKEAIVNALPIVSNDVGDVKAICSGADHCFIVPKQVSAYVSYLKHLSQTYPRIQNRDSVKERFNNRCIATKLFETYCLVLQQKPSEPITQLHY